MCRTTYTFVSQREMGDWTVKVYRNDQAGEFDWRGRTVTFDQAEHEDDGQGFETEAAAYEDADFQINRDRGTAPDAE